MSICFLVISFCGNCVAFAKKLRNVRWMKTDRWRLILYFSSPLLFFLFFLNFSAQCTCCVKNWILLFRWIVRPSWWRIYVWIFLYEWNVWIHICFDLRQRVKHVDSFRSFPCKINRIAILLQVAFLGRSNLGRWRANDLSIIFISFVNEGRNFDSFLTRYREPHRHVSRMDNWIVCIEQIIYWLFCSLITIDLTNLTFRFLLKLIELSSNVFYARFYVIDLHSDMLWAVVTKNGNIRAAILCLASTEWIQQTKFGEIYNSGYI